jgi:hypothetical protein
VESVGQGCGLRDKSPLLSPPSTIPSHTDQTAAMDPLSIIGGIVAVGQAAGVVAKCADVLYKISYTR